MAYSWDNRVKFVVRYMYDIDGNGTLDKSDFECLAVRNTVIEGKGDWNEATFKKNQEVMANLWNEIAELADFNKDGEVDGKEFADAVQKNCMNKPFAELPAAFKAFIHEAFKSIDVDGNFNRKMPKTPKRRLICITERVQNRYLPFFDISVSIINSLL